MTDIMTRSAYGELIEPATLKIERRLPGPIERVWSYLTDGDLRKQWLAAGDMELKAGAGFTFTWRNDELTDPPGQRPDGFGEEHSLDSQITEVDPPHKLVFTWGEGTVAIALKPLGNDVLLTLIHTRLPDRNMTLMVGAGWHTHLDLLVAKISGGNADPFWDTWVRLKGEYDARVPD